VLAWSAACRRGGVFKHFVEIFILDDYAELYCVFVGKIVLFVEGFQFLVRHVEVFESVMDLLENG
jgi:hypothetical protein